MNKKILIASAVALATSMSFGLDTWFGTDGVYQITTGVDEEGDAGYWYYYTDEDSGGNSTLTWPTDTGNDYDDSALDPIIDACGGVCGSVTIGTGYSYGFVGIGFNLGGGSQPAVDVTDWGGVDLCYISDVKFGIELGNDDMTEYDNFNVLLSAKTSNTLSSNAWTDFEQEGWGTTIDIGTATANMTALKFKISKSWGASTGTAYFINLTGVGEYGAISSCPSSSATSFANASSPITSSAKASSSVKAMLSGRTLSFSGVNSAARAEVINLQGQVVMNSTISGSSALNLSSLNSGVYMVRLAGQGVNYTQRITLK